MFPLSSVLFPHSRVALHVFEPRYRTMVADCLEGERRFGVVLIARGSEVGGGDVRVDTGTLASIESAEPLADGGWNLVVCGHSLIRVTRWLADAPYPRGLVEDVADVPGPDADALRRAEAELRRVRALLSELGTVPALPAGLSLGDEPGPMMWHLCALAPVDSFDRQRLLEAPGPDDRLALLLELLGDVGEDVERILRGG
jgi:Lon protease-like protein